MKCMFGWVELGDLEVYPNIYNRQNGKDYINTKVAAGAN